MLSCTSTNPSSLPLTVVIGSSLAAITATVMVIFLLIHGEGPDLMTRIVASSTVSLTSLVTCAIAAVKMRCDKKRQALQTALLDKVAPLHPDKVTADMFSHVTTSLPQVNPPPSNQQPSSNTTATTTVHDDDDDAKSNTSDASFYSARASQSPSPAPASTNTALASTATEVHPFDTLSVEECQPRLLATIRNIFVLLASKEKGVATKFKLSPLSEQNCLTLFKTFEPMSKVSLAADMLLPELKRQVEAGGRIPSVLELSKAAILDLPNTKDQTGKFVLSGWLERNSLLVSMQTCISFNPTSVKTVELLEKALPEKLLPKIARQFSASLFVAVRNSNSPLYQFLTEKLTPYLTDLQEHYKANKALDNPSHQEQLMTGLYKIMLRHLTALTQDLEKISTQPLSN